MSLLTVIQYVAGRTGVTVPSSVLGTSDPQVLQLLRLLEEEGEDLRKRGPWQGIVKEASWTSTAAEDQGAVTTLAASGFDYIKKDTFWDRTSKFPIIGPLSDSEWQARQALAITGPRYSWRIRGGKMLISPVPAASLTFVFEYISKNWILGVDGTTYKQYFTLDTDTILLPEELVIMGLRWRWKKEKGFDYAEDFRTYEAQVKDALGRDGGKVTLSMDGSIRKPQPGVFIPDQSWSL
jgi:hypothetical protein